MRREAWPILACCAGAALGVLSPAAPAWPKTLAEVVRQTIAINPEVSRDRALLRAAGHKVDERFAGFLPKVDLDADTGWEYTNSPSTRTRTDKEPDDNSSRKQWRSDGSVRFRQMVFDGFETTDREVSAEAERVAAERRLDATSERIAQNVADRYLEMLATTELLRLAEENEAYHREIAGKVAERVQQGLTDQIELDLATSRVALATALLFQRRGEQRAAEARYLELIGDRPEGLVRPEAPSGFTPADADLAIEQALRDNPRVAATAATLDARRADIGAARAKFYPRLDFEVTGTTAQNVDGDKGRESHIQVMLRLRYDLFNGMFDVATVSRRSFEAAAAAEADGEARRRVREETRVAYRLLFAAIARVAPLLDTAKSTRRTVEGYLEQYDLGKRSLLDLLDTRRDLFEAQSELVQAEYASLRRYYGLYFSMGRLRDVLEKSGQ
jgi:adhesin transport system outer membrane protein